MQQHNATPQCFSCRGFPLQGTLEIVVLLLREEVTATTSPRVPWKKKPVLVKPVLELVWVCSVDHPEAHSRATPGNRDIELFYLLKKILYEKLVVTW